MFSVRSQLTTETAELFNKFRASVDLVIRFWNGNGVALVMDDRKLGGILRWKIYRNATTRKRRVIHFGMKGNAKEMKNAAVRYSYRWLSRQRVGNLEVFVEA